MSSTASTALYLPKISEVDAADHTIGAFKSDLDKFKSAAETFVRFVSLNDGMFLEKAGIEVREQRRNADPAIIARLLVFADEVLDDVDQIREDALALRRDLLTAYREFVIERHLWREHEEERVDA